MLPENNSIKIIRDLIFLKEYLNTNLNNYTTSNKIIFKTHVTMYLNCLNINLLYQ